MENLNFQHLQFSNLQCDIHYWYKKGTAQKYVIFLHGAGMNHEMFIKQLEIFDETYNLILWDARGHGLSKFGKAQKFVFQDMVADLLKLYEIYKIDNAILIGQSMGGNLAQEFAYRHSEKVAKIVLIDSTINIAKLTFSEKFLLKISRPIFKMFPWKMLVDSSANACGNDIYVKEYAAKCLNHTGKEVFIDVMMSLLLCLREDENYRFKQPVLMLCGEDDKTGNIKKAMPAWAAKDKNCKLFMINNAAHNSNQDNPQLVNEKIKLFID